MALSTLLDIAKQNGNDPLVGLIEENLTFAPEMEFIPARPIRGTSYSTVVRTGFPFLGFRIAWSGFLPGKSTFENRTVESFIFGGVIQVDKAVAMAHEDGQAAFEMIEANGVTKNAAIRLGSQVWYGTTADTNGFSGIKQLLPKGSIITVDAGGTAANSASSVYAIKFGVQDVSFVIGENGTMTLAPFTDQQLPDPNDATLVIPCRVSDLNAWVGLQVGNRNCIGRIFNLTTDVGKGLTDNLLAELLALFPIGSLPDAIFMSRRSRRQLQISRPVVITDDDGKSPKGGDSKIGPVPTDYEGIPIYATDSILDVDAIET